MAEVLPDSLQPAAEELGGYFADSFGNATRIDYGTGGVCICQRGWDVGVEAWCGAGMHTRVAAVRP